MKTPDGGEVGYWYDDKGRVRFSQNEKQVNTGSYSYTVYDALGRIIETGEYQGSINSTLINTANFPLSITYSGCSFVTLTTYSTDFGSSPYFWNYGLSIAPTQEFLHNRVSFVQTDQDGQWNTVNDRVVTVYSYDAHGNVKDLYQWMSGMPTTIVKQMKYEFEPIKGKVTELKLMNDNFDEFSQVYEYDADRRLKHVWVYHHGSDPVSGYASGGFFWNEFNPPTDMYKSTYWYYKHGLLKRHEVGFEKQGLDYTYTLQGWLKGINHSSGNPSDDPGQDGINGTTPQDAFSMVLNYHDGDFNRSGSPFNTNGTNSLYVGSTEKSFYIG